MNKPSYSSTHPHGLRRFPKKQHIEELPPLPETHLDALNRLEAQCQRLYWLEPNPPQPLSIWGVAALDTWADICGRIHHAERHDRAIQ